MSNDKQTENGKLTIVQLQQNLRKALEETANVRHQVCDFMLN